MHAGNESNATLMLILLVACEHTLPLSNIEIRRELASMIPTRVLKTLRGQNMPKAGITAPFDTYFGFQLVNSVLLYMIVPSVMIEHFPPLVQ